MVAVLVGVVVGVVGGGGVVVDDPGCSSLRL